MKLSDYALPRRTPRQTSDDQPTVMAYEAIGSLIKVFTMPYTNEQKATDIAEVARQMCRIAVDLGAGEADFVFDGVRNGTDQDEDFYNAAHEILDSFTDSILYKLESERNDIECYHPSHLASGIKVLLDELITFSVRHFNIDICPIMESWRTVGLVREEICQFRDEIVQEVVGTSVISEDVFIANMSDKLHVWFNLKYAAWCNDYPEVFNIHAQPVITAQVGQDAAGNKVESAVLFTVVIDTSVGNLTGSFLFK